MKSWIKVGLAGCLVLVAGLWGGSVRAGGNECLQPQSSGYGVERYDGQRYSQRDGQRDGQSANSSRGIRWERQGSAPKSDGALAP